LVSRGNYREPAIFSPGCSRVLSFSPGAATRVDLNKPDLLQMPLETGEVFEWDDRDK